MREEAVEFMLVRSYTDAKTASDCCEQNGGQLLRIDSYNKKDIVDAFLNGMTLDPIIDRWYAQVGIYFYGRHILF